MIKMKFSRFLFPAAFILIASCADDNRVEVPLNAQSLSNGSSATKVSSAAEPLLPEMEAPSSATQQVETWVEIQPAPAPVETAGAKVPVIIERQNLVPIQRVIIIRSREQVEGVEFTNDLYIAPAAKPFVKSAEPVEHTITAPTAPAVAPAERTVAAAQQPRPRSAARLPESRKSSITFLASVIYHKDGRADISVRDKAAIAEVAGFMLEKEAHARVYGHASAASRGLKPEAAKKANFEVSKKRALTVRRELIANRVPSGNVRAFAVSDRRPAVPETSPKAEATNRRTEIFVKF